MPRPGSTLWTSDAEASRTFYGELFGWEYDPVSDSDEFRYTMVRNPDGEMVMAGIMDNRNDLAEGTPAIWAIYREVADVDASVAVAVAGGATVVHPAEDTPYGQLAEFVDPNGASLNLRQNMQWPYRFQWSRLSGFFRVGNHVEAAG